MATQIKNPTPRLAQNELVTRLADSEKVLLNSLRQISPTIRAPIREKIFAASLNVAKAFGKSFLASSNHSCGGNFIFNLGDGSSDWLRNPRY